MAVNQHQTCITDLEYNSKTCSFKFNNFWRCRKIGLATIFPECLQSEFGLYTKICSTNWKSLNIQCAKTLFALIFYSMKVGLIDGRVDPIRHLLDTLNTFRLSFILDAVDTSPYPGQAIRVKNHFKTKISKYGNMSSRTKADEIRTLNQQHFCLVSINVKGNLWRCRRLIHPHG